MTATLTHIVTTLRTLRDELWAEAHAANRAAQQASIDGADPEPLQDHAAHVTARAQMVDGLLREACGLNGCGHDHAGDWLTVVPEQRRET